MSLGLPTSDVFSHGTHQFLIIHIPSQSWASSSHCSPKQFSANVGDKARDARVRSHQIYTQTPLHTEFFTHRDFTHRRFFTQTLLHTDPFAYRPFYTQRPHVGFGGPNSGPKPARNLGPHRRTPQVMPKMSATSTSCYVRARCLSAGLRS